MLRFCRRMLRNEEDARDQSQEALLRATRGLERYDERRPFAPWIYRVARNVCLNHIEKERLRSGPPAPDDPPASAPPPDVLIAHREEAARVRKAIRRLPEADRKLLERKLVRGQSNEEIARGLGIRAGTLRTRACRALARLRRALDEGRGEVRR